jgi:photosystem II stability/assembly factor-like uncharacterized protein
MSTAHYFCRYYLPMLLCLADTTGLSQTDFWVPTNGPQGGRITSLAVGRNGRIFAAANPWLWMDSGAVFLSTDQGNSWNTILPGCRGRTFYSLAVTRPGVIFAGGRDSSEAVVFRSTDNGGLWTKIVLSATLAGQSLAVVSLGVHPGNLVFAGLGSIYLEPDGCLYRSTDEGINWIESGLNRFQVHCLAIDSVGNIFAGIDCWYDVVCKAGLYRSTDDGGTWDPRSDVIYVVKSIAITPMGHIFAGSGSGTFRSTDSGTSWSMIKLNAEGPLVANADGHVFAGIATDKPQVYRTTDDGETWKLVDAGLKSGTVTALAVDSSGYVLAGTSDGLVYRTANPTVTASETDHRSPVSFSLIQNYPNPFNPSTTIKYELPKASHVNVSVYDMLGHEVLVLVNERKAPGSYDVKFDGTGLSSAVYFYRLQAGDFVQTRKLLLLR